MGNSESSIRSKLENKPIVVIVGGGPAGVIVAQGLEKEMNVILIDRKNHFLHNIAALRATVDPSFAKRIAIPYSKALPFGQILQAEVQEISPEGIKLQGHDTIVKFDYLVIATGTSYAFPSKVAEPSAEKVVSLYAESRASIEKANKILIIGGGPVGVELLGELIHVFPKKNYTLVHSRDHLIPGPTLPEFKEKLLTLVKAQENVRLILGEKVVFEGEEENLNSHPTRFLEGTRNLKTDKGSEIEADLIFFCGGAKVNSASYEKNFPINEEKRIKVNNQLQVEGHQKIFALGDCSDFPDTKTFWAIKSQAPVVVKNILALQKETSLTTCQPAAVGMVVPFGPEKGYAQFPIGAGKVFGPKVTKMVKGKGLFLASSWEILHQKFPSRDPSEFNFPPDIEEEKVKRFSSLMKLDADALKKMIEEVNVENAENEQGYT